MRPATAAAVRCQDCGLHTLCYPPSFAGDTLDRVASLVGQGEPLPSGSLIYAQGDAPEHLYAVRSGAVKTVMTDADGNEQITGFYLPGEVVGLENLGQSACVAAAVTLGRTAVCALPVDGISALSRQLPDLQQHLFRIMSTALRADYQRQHLLARGSADRRLASFLLGLAARQRQRRLDDRDLRLPMSRADLGNHLGLALETVSRAFGALQDQGILAVSGKQVSILDSDRLADLGAGHCR